ncbi:sensor domain-containing protein [Streptomyces albiaxialis]|uniref:histidine kinase n=1 Tax=Streptomyces albiaxialis TaxID=329523 RepID=A0ABP5HCI2_9ACTN
MTPFRGFLSRGLTGLRRCLTLWRLSWAATGLTFCAVLFSSGPGLLVLPNVREGVRRLASRQRELAGSWSGVRVPEPASGPPAPGTPLRYRFQAVFAERQARREWLWVALDPVVGATLAFLPILTVLAGIWGIGFALTGLSGVYTPGLALTLPAGLLGAAALPLTLWAAPRLVRVHALWIGSMLSPSESERMAHRIEHLSATRSAAVDTQMSELRRIERDLHDGAQARLVAMGMTLDAADELLERDPEAVRALLAEVRQSSAQALEELRDLVRGIHPPVLADRGLADAVRALALVSPLSAEVSLDLPGRPEMPVESAVYFAVSEALANAAKHSGADRVWIDLTYDYARGVLRAGVTDDGRGGADASRGTGLRGIERRLATFDGVLAVNSPPGGPTMVMMELPCVLSSPKTISC